jgi:hypothetical protein
VNISQQRCLFHLKKNKSCFGADPRGNIFKKSSGAGRYFAGRETVNKDTSAAAKEIAGEISRIYL